MDFVQALHVMRQGFQARLIPTYEETTLSAIHNLHPEQYVHFAIFAAVGALLASVTLFAIGVWLRRLPEKISTPEQRVRIEHLRLMADEWLLYLLILSPSPIGGMLIIAAGFFQVPVLRASLAILAAELLWRISPLLGS